ncbi:Mu transposase domain-containing protein [Kitasatospora aureofaciens]|uniref:Mu transposase domain-containing protein n=1 Tax=Kitasatospora aureofaciens TaxID=1894 RepID=UPI001C481521|nr:IS21 family transposase [Kitasatospora aureofaciens]MBV6697858.1 IS21 family transposase [Kitasatospora aureofaciens]
MLTKEEFDEAHSRRAQGWSISAIARHLGRDRKTVRSYLDGERIAGVRSCSQDDFAPFSPYCRQRLADDPHLRASTLFEEVVELGYPGGYSTFTRAVRKHQLRPRCGQCQRLAGDHSADHSAKASHPASEEVRFDWLTLPNAPARWGGGGRAHLLLGSLTRTGRWRAVLAENEEFPQVVEAMDQLLRRLGGTGARWQFHRTPSACCPETGRVTPAFSEVAKYYDVAITCPPCWDDRDGVPDETVCSTTRHWWRSVRNETPLRAAQDRLDGLAARMDCVRPTGREPGAARDGASGLLDLPSTPFPARICVTREVTAQNVVPFRGNLYAVPPELSGASVQVCWRLDEPYVSISTTRGAVIARHAVAPRGAGVAVTGRGHSIVLERPLPIRAAPCPANTYHPPSAAALAEAEALGARDPA